MRSTIITFSARSFSLARSSSARRRSSAAIRAARAGSLDRVRPHRARLDLEEPLGAGAGERDIARADESAVVRRRHLPEALEGGDGIDSSLDREARREAELVGIAFADRIAAPLDEARRTRAGRWRAGRDAGGRRAAARAPARRRAPASTSPRERVAPRRRARPPTPGGRRGRTRRIAPPAATRRAGSPRSAAATGAPARGRGRLVPEPPDPAAAEPPRRPAVGRGRGALDAADPLRGRGSGTPVPDPAPARPSASGPASSQNAWSARCRAGGEDGCRIPPPLERDGDERGRHVPRLGRGPRA